MPAQSASTWSRFLEDSSISGGLERCLRALKELWGTDDISVFVRRPGGKTVSRYYINSQAQLKKEQQKKPGENVQRLLQLSVRAERYFDPKRHMLYLRQRRADKPHAVLRIGDQVTAQKSNPDISQSTKAILMAAVAYIESYDYIQTTHEPLIAEKMKRDFRNYITPICEQISQRSFLTNVGFIKLQDQSNAEVLYAAHYHHGAVQANADNLAVLNKICQYIEKKTNRQNGIQHITKNELGPIRPTDHGFLDGVDHILFYFLHDKYFRGAVIFGVPTDYEITDSDISIINFIKDQFLNYVYIYSAYNQERYELIRQQQQFGIEYAEDFTQVARHAARQNIGHIVDNAELLNIIAGSGKRNEKDRISAYEGISDAVNKIDNVYSEVKSLTEDNPERETVYLRDLFDDVAATFHNEFDSGGIQFENEILHSEAVSGYSQQLKVAIFNLFQNSCEAFMRNNIPRNSRHILAGYSGKKGRPIIYQDTAGGIRNLKTANGEEVKDAQLAWKRGVSSSGGSGFGMHLIKRYLEANQCKISLQTSKKGTRFTIDTQEVRAAAGNHKR